MQRTLRMLVQGGRNAPPPPCVLVLIGGELDPLWWHLEQGWPIIVLTGSGGAAGIVETLLARESLPPEHIMLYAHETLRRHRQQIHLTRGAVEGELEEVVERLC